MEVLLENSGKKEKTHGLNRSGWAIATTFQTRFIKDRAPRKDLGAKAQIWDMLLRSAGPLWRIGSTKEAPHLQYLSDSRGDRRRRFSHSPYLTGALGVC